VQTVADHWRGTGWGASVEGQTLTELAFYGMVEHQARVIR